MYKIEYHTKTSDFVWIVELCGKKPGLFYSISKRRDNKVIESFFLCGKYLEREVDDFCDGRYKIPPYTDDIEQNREQIEQAIAKALEDEKKIKETKYLYDQKSDSFLKEADCWNSSTTTGDYVKVREEENGMYRFHIDIEDYVHVISALNKLVKTYYPNWS